MSDNWLFPKGTDLAKAIHWLGTEGRHDLKAIEEASLRYDLSPADEAFLLEHFRDRMADSPK